MEPRDSLPLTPGAFAVSDARSAGISEGRLRSADLLRPFHGVRSTRLLSGAEPRQLRAAKHGVTAQRAQPTGTSTLQPVHASDFEGALELCRDYAPILGPHQFFSHQSAALLWGCPLPRTLQSDLLHVSVLSPTRAPRGRGVCGHRAAPDRVAIVQRHALPVADPASMWLSLAAVIPPDELVAVGDHLVLDPWVLSPSDPRPYISIESLREAVERYSGRGARAAASAIQLVRAGSESRPETLLRLTLGRAGLPEPQLNQDVCDFANRWLARVDLLYPEYRVVVEYDGDHHRVDSAQYDKDILRIEKISNAGYRVVRVRKAALFATPATTVHRVAAALGERGWPGR